MERATQIPGLCWTHRSPRDLPLHAAAPYAFTTMIVIALMLGLALSVGARGLLSAPALD